MSETKSCIEQRRLCKKSECLLQETLRERALDIGHGDCCTALHFIQIVLSVSERLQSLGD
jgi:hypothetical protein